MQRLTNWMAGYAFVRAEGAFPERLLNLCAQDRLPFWGLKWEDETAFTLTVRLRDMGRLEQYAQRAMCTLTVRARRGFTAALLRWRRRWGFALGVTLAFLAVAVLSRFVLVVEVTGNETVSAAVVLSELQRLGVRPGVYGPSLDRTALANEALLSLPELSFMALNLHGTRLEVVVREAEKAPELLDEDTPADVVAAADGIIEDIHAAAGRAMFEDGDTVARGEELISGDVELRRPEGSDYDMGRLVVRAAGDVTARTWRTLTASTPLTVRVKERTGAEKTLYSAGVLWGTLDFYRNSGISYTKYDKITETKPLTLFGRALPFTWTAMTYREYDEREQTIDAEAARAMLEQELLARLDGILAEDGEVLRTDFICEERDGLFTVTMLAECREQIGKTVERPGETGRVYGESAGETGVQAG